MNKDEKRILFKGLCQAFPYLPKVYDKRNKRILNIDMGLTLDDERIGLIVCKHAPETYIPIFRRIEDIGFLITVEGYNNGKVFSPMDEIDKILSIGGLNKLGKSNRIKENPMKFLNGLSIDLLNQWGFWLYDQTFFKKGYIIEFTRVRKE